MENKTLEILKMAILNERRGQAFYSKVAEQTNINEVKEIFKMMAKEEVLHEEFLSKEYKNYRKNNMFEVIDFPKEGPDSIASHILSDDIKKQISSAGFEAAAISAAIDMETKAINVYTERAKSATDANEKALYNWLAEWEKSHHKILLELDNELKEKVWFDNQFWPF